MVSQKEIKEIYHRLCDEESRRIFEKRLLFSLTEDYSYISEMLSMNRERIKINEIFSHLFKKKLAIFGAGFCGKALLSVFPEMKWTCFIDNHLKTEWMCGLKVVSLEKFMEEYEDIMIVISSETYYSEIIKQLYDAGINAKDIINVGEIIDKQSEMPYFGLKHLKHNEKEVFVDGGCFDGNSTVKFLEWCKNDYKSVWAFEPDERNFIKCRNNLLLQDKNIHIEQKGLWSSVKSLRFASLGSPGAAISSVGEVTVPVIDLDSGLYREGVSFIKLDVEGAELEALYGAEKIIRDSAPQLAICIYHKPQDIWEIPALLLRYNSEYKFYIRHHFPFGAVETVLYAIADN